MNEAKHPTKYHFHNSTKAPAVSTHASRTFSKVTKKHFTKNPRYFSRSRFPSRISASDASYLNVSVHRVNTQR